ncbi:MAG: hypothetical protein EOP66_00180 [Sphingomonas sp.]|nr:MAG: hypothetical protein EOP66_00180 [Sphingomonas sp.]
MKDLLDQVEERRIALGLSQKTVANRLAISQPHYSKVVGSLAVLTPEMEGAMRRLLDSMPAPTVIPGPRAVRIRSLTRSIRQQLRELNILISQEAVSPGGRPARRARSKRQGDGRSSS